MIYSNSYFNDPNFRPGDFVLSTINSADMEKYGIKGSVNEFKKLVKQARKYKVIMTGGNGYRRHTRVYNYHDFVNLSHKISPVISLDYWWNE